MKTTYKRHPVFKEVWVSNCGKKVKQYGQLLPVREVQPKPNNSLMVVYLYGTYFSLPKLVLETYKGYPDTDKKCYAICIDGNHKNTHPDNLEWSNTNRHFTPEKAVEFATKRSKLSKEDSFKCYVLFKGGKKTLKQLAIEHNTSGMSIHRAVKRIERYINSKKSG